MRGADVEVAVPEAAAWVCELVCSLFERGGAYWRASGAMAKPWLGDRVFVHGVESLCVGINRVALVLAERNRDVL